MPRSKNRRKNGRCPVNDNRAPISYDKDIKPKFVAINEELKRATSARIDAVAKGQDQTVLPMPSVAVEPIFKELTKMLPRMVKPLRMVTAKFICKFRDHAIQADKDMEEFEAAVASGMEDVVALVERAQAEAVLTIFDDE